MYKPGRQGRFDEHELLTVPADQSFQTSDSHINRNHALGVPQRSHRLWLADYLSTSLCLLCFGVCLVTVFVSDVATRLGQVNQLIVLGALLQLMALCTSRNVRAFLFALECFWNGSYLQNYEAIMTNSFTVPSTSFVVRSLILINMMAPVGLGIAYKRFTGDRMLTAPVTESGFVGMVGPSGTVGLGSAGLALLVNATATWWSNPVSFGPFGFNLNVESPNRTALMDAPTPELVSRLQGMLSDDEYLVVDATVNAIVTDMVIDLTNSNQKSDLAYWYQNATASTVTAEQATDDFWHTNSSNLTLSLLVPDVKADTLVEILSPVSNDSLILTARFNQTAGETVGTNTQGFHSYRQQYKAAWDISKTSVLLRSAEPIPGAILRDNNSIALIEDNDLVFGNNFIWMFSEFDWKNGYLDFANVSNTAVNAGLSIQQRYIKSDTTLVAASLWSLLSISLGPGNPLYLQLQAANLLSPLDESLRYTTPIQHQRSVLVLHRSWVLALILAINPAVLAVSLLMRLTLLRDAPISNGFGVMSLLSAVDANGLDLLRGAAYSGTTKKAVHVAFAVSEENKSQDAMDVGDDSATPTSSRHIRMMLQDSNRRERSTFQEYSHRPRVKLGKVYG